VLTGLVIHQVELIHPVLLNTEELRGFTLELTELNILGDGKLTGNGSIIRFLGTVNNDLLC